MNEMSFEETFLVQVLIDGKWTDYGRGTESQARNEINCQPAEKFRAVDWIDKERVLIPPRAPRTPERAALLGVCR